ncbi:MAG: DUF721 domain-containing protein [Alphaproteobacteria bacterium]|nr:DUF721 domain-containing protein [Alphaproteobacteria bacterium]
MRQLSEATARIIGRNFNRKYVALGRIVKVWSDIVGAELADKAQPVKINYRKAKVRGEKPKASLDIAVSSSNATLLHYQKDLILERINQIFGERWVTNIRFVNIPVNILPVKRKKIKIPLTNIEKNTLSDILCTISDKEIKSKLEKLGTAVVEESKS